ncbi:hypothetical protein BpHYR1_032159 [Brachionus plicatilis]|uniref:Uncharacterized protein n=1 Tax=Brachionus plicatilis TaxID=10195 RepID=A0A3M7PFE2_BRAPC|nr:hypothetical protein BpHYR1_032159 [Brachionus plicatilis]
MKMANLFSFRFDYIVSIVNQEIEKKSNLSFFLFLNLTLIAYWWEIKVLKNNSIKIFNRNSDFFLSENLHKFGHFLAKVINATSKFDPSLFHANVCMIGHRHTGLNLSFLQFVRKIID